MTSRRAGALALVALGIVATALLPSGATASATAERQSLTVFPSAIDVDIQRGELVERSVGVTQTGRAARDVRIDVTGDAAPYLALLDAETGETVDRLEGVTSEPTFLLVRLAPTDPVPDGPATATVELRTVDDDVVVGSRLQIRLDVSGDRSLSVDVRDISVPDAVEVGAALPITLTAQVDGNADLVPVVDVALAGPDGAHEELSARPAIVAPGGERTIAMRWPTTGWTTGRYRGDLVLRSGGLELVTLEVAVDVVPTGSRLRAVTVLGAAVVSEARPNGVAKLEVEVRNDGALSGRAVFAGDLLRETETIAPLRSDPVVIDAGEVATLTVYARLDDAGEYRARGRVTLDQVDSSLFAVEFTATEDHRMRWLVLAAVAAAAVAAFAVIASSARARR